MGLACKKREGDREKILSRGPEIFPKKPRISHSVSRIINFSPPLHEIYHDPSIWISCCAFLRHLFSVLCLEISFIINRRVDDILILPPLLMLVATHPNRVDEIRHCQGCFWQQLRRQMWWWWREGRRGAKSIWMRSLSCWWPKSGANSTLTAIKMIYHFHFFPIWPLNVFAQPQKLRRTTSRYDTIPRQRDRGRPSGQEIQRNEGPAK